MNKRLKLLIAVLLLTAAASQAQLPNPPDYIGFCAPDTNVLTLVINHTKVISVWNLGQNRAFMQTEPRELSVYYVLDTIWYGNALGLEYRRYRMAKKIYSLVTPDNTYKLKNRGALCNAIISYQALFYRIH